MRAAARKAETLHTAVVTTETPAFLNLFFLGRERSRERLRERSRERDQEIEIKRERSRERDQERDQKTEIGRD